MQIIDQNNAIASLNNALVPGPYLIDGRMEQDWLSFLSHFASLINFYDHQNNQVGNWAPFLLKDPVFLLAFISKTKFTERYGRYQQVCQQLAAVLKNMTADKGAEADQHLKNPLRNIPSREDIGILFNRLFDELVHVFMLIKKWVYYMQLSDEVYDLKTYVIHQTRTDFSRYFWAIVSLRENLFFNNLIYGLKATDTSSYYFSSEYEEKIWKQNKDKTPYQEILGLDIYIKNQLPIDFFKALAKVGDNVFNFFHTIIEHANLGFEKVKAKKSAFPDTLLLRTFVELLKNHQQQLNKISNAHLQFYYQTILKQSILTAKPDSVFITAELAKKDTAFTLPKGTLFSAGADLQNNPISFVSTADVSLNPAIISEAYTLSKSKSDHKLYLNNIGDPTVIKKDKNGVVQAWDTFGGNIEDAIEQKLSIAIASPMLLLREGHRRLVLDFIFINENHAEFLQQAKFYLSTKEAWLEVFPEKKEGHPPRQQVIYLSKKQLSIEPFAVKTDGFLSQWPILKIEFDSNINYTMPPVLSSLKILVQVTQLKTFSLYNAFGALSTKAAFLPLGPTPTLNSSFIIGNNEVFSKPLGLFKIRLNWNNLPNVSFSTYYKQYNKYIDYLNKHRNDDSSSQHSLWNRTKKIFSKSTEKEKELVHEHFHNNTFRVDFKILDDQQWNDVEIRKEAHIHNDVAKNKEKIRTYYWVKIDTLFKGTDERLIKYSDFTVQTPRDKKVANPDPTIQLTPLKFADASKTGFVKMELIDPEYGFGSGIYPNVITELALRNARIIANKTCTALKPSANAPFAPKATDLEGGYASSFTYNFNTADQYPIECYLYTPFSNYKIYDTTNGMAKAVAPIPAHTIIGSSPKGIPLINAYENDGFLFLGIDELIPLQTINLYFELVRKDIPFYIPAQADTNDNKFKAYYLGTTGWNELDVLVDGTNNFKRSGIISVFIPEDIAFETEIMPQKKYWLAITATNISAFAQTIFLKTNGMKLQRYTTASNATFATPKILANAITKTQTPVQQLGKITQPFPSFGGSAAEDEQTMNQRVSRRLKTKDRLVTAADYYAIIKQKYPNIYHAKTGSANNKTTVFVVKTYDSWTEANAFRPMVDEYTQQEMELFINQKNSAFSKVKVMNFGFKYALAKVKLQKVIGFEAVEVTNNVTHAINIFLSPWISSNQPQTSIGENIDLNVLTNLIKNTAGVLAVESVEIDFERLQEQEEGNTIVVSKMKHLITLS